MELIRISDRKLKIMLTPMDMRHFELNPDRFGEDSAQMHRSFRLLLSEVRRQTDFNADDSHLSVQYFPSREGGCEMFICNLQDADETTPLSLSASPPCTEIRPYKKRNGGFRRDCAYRLSKLDHLLAVCRRLKNRTCILHCKCGFVTCKQFFPFAKLPGCRKMGKHIESLSHGYANRIF